MYKSLRDYLCCPNCQGELIWDVDNESKTRIIDADISCRNCDQQYFVKDEIAIFLVNTDNEDDFWKLVDSNLGRALKENPNIESNLMKSDFRKLNAADKFLRSMIHNERGDYDAAREIQQIAAEELYTSSYSESYDLKISQLKEILKNEQGLIVDLASGMASFAEIFEELDNLVVFSDISPTVLQRNKMRLSHFKLYDDVSLMAFDAKKMPFKENSIPIFTTNMGLTNITNSKEFVKELARCMKKVAFGLTFFFPENGDANAKFLDNNGMQFGFENQLIDISSQYLTTSLLHPSLSDIIPTVESEIFDIGIDSLPQVPTRVKWALVKFSPKSSESNTIN